MAPVAAAVGPGRAVEVLHDRGPGARADVARWTGGSGYLIGGRLVLTAAHNVEHGQDAGADGQLLVRTVAGGEFTARVLLVGDAPSSQDLALLEVTDPGFVDNAARVRFAQVDRDSAAAVTNCWAVGFPWFGETSPVLPEGSRRETWHVRGEIMPGGKLRAGLLAWEVSIHPRPLPDGSLAGSEWAGMSGAVVFATDPYAGDLAIGVVVEHHRAEGESALTVVPITALTELPDGGSMLEWWRQLQVNPDHLPVLPRPPSQVASGEALAGQARTMRVVSARVGGFTDVVGREGLLAQIHADLTSARRSAGRPVWRVLTGLGGVGKTSVARAYADRYQDRYGLVWWVAAENPDAVAGEFRGLLELLAPQEVNQVADPVAAVHAILASRADQWLLVLDNVADPTAVRELLPAAGDGDVLVTSRWGAWPRARQVLTVPPLAADDAISLLVVLSGDNDPDTAGRLATELGGLPLALAQAGSYIRQTPGLTLADYLSLYRRHRSQVLAEGRLPDYDATVATTWRLAVGQLPADARALLNVLCWYAPDFIPVTDLFTANVDTDDLPEQTAGLASLLADDFARNRSFAILLGYSLLSEAGGGAVDVHRLVQAVTADQLTNAAASGPWIEAARVLLDAVLPTGPATAAKQRTWLRLQTHATALLDHLPPDHPTTLAARHRLAYWTGEAGDVVAARDLFAGLLKDRVRVLGPDHPHTLATRRDLAYWTGRAGNVVAARDLFAALLEDRTRVLGPDHLDTLAARHELAYWTGEAGDVVAARDLFAGLLKDRVRVLGPDHPHSLATRHEFARLTGEAGDATAAWDLFAGLLKDRVRVLGPDHPHTLTTRHELARWTGEAGNATAARDLFAALLEDRARILGPDSFRTLVTRHRLARWTGEAGNAAAARDLLAGLYDDTMRALGPDHPHTLATRHELAHWTGEAGDIATARELFAALLKDQVRVLGTDHPHTLASRHQLAHWTQQGGDATADTSF